MAAYGLSLWDDGLAICKAAKAAGTEEFQIQFEMLPLLGDATDTKVVTRMLSASTLLSDVKILVTCYQPTDAEKLSYWGALYKALSSVYPTTEIVTASQDDRLTAASRAVGRNLNNEALQSVGDTADLQFGSPQRRKLFNKQCSLLREAAQEYLTSSNCSNSSTAHQQYNVLLEQSYGPQARWYVTDALWQAVHGVIYKEAQVKRKQRVQQRRQQWRERQQQRQQHREEKERLRRERDRQQQQQRAEQQRQQQQQQRRAEQAAADLSAAAPDVKGMRQQQLMEFLQQLGVAVSSSLTTQELQSLAQSSLKLWEAKRLAKCGKYISHQSNITNKLDCARMVFRLGASSSSSSSSTAALVKKVHKALALLVHPDKTPVGFGGFREVFEEGFKALRTAYDLLVR